MLLRLLLLFSFTPLLGALVELPIVVVIPSYKNAKWYEKNLNSVLSQNYSNYRVIYIDDCSPDMTGQKVGNYFQNHNLDYKIISFDDSNSGDINETTAQFCKKINEEPHQFVLVQNLHRCGALENLYRAIYSANPNEIIATLDGDDWLYHNRVLEELNKIYSKGNIWLTHGKLIEYPNNNTQWCQPVPNLVIKKGSFRQFRCPSHLRTFYAWLFRKIELSDLLYQGKFFPMTWDMAIMFPMIEMASERHAFISSPNYVYNVANQLNDNKVNAQLQKDLDILIRAMRPYKRL